MRILIDSFSKKYGLTLNELLFLDKSFQLLLHHHSEHEWIFDAFEVTKGVISLLPMGIKKSIVLNKINPDVIVTKVELEKKYSEKYKQLFFFNQAMYAKKKLGTEMSKHAMVITTSEELQRKIGQSFQIDASHIRVIPAAPAEDVTLADWSEKLQVKENYADGREFFLCFKEIGVHTKWEEILKAFSIFKKWQQSSFKLLMVGEVESAFQEEFEQKMKSYKYRSDVKILDPKKEDVNRILSTAFAIICGDADYTGMNILNGFQSEVPVISSPVEVFDEVVSGIFLPAIPMADELSRQLINIYRDERLRETLVEKGREIVKQFSWKHTEERWMKCLKFEI